MLSDMMYPTRLLNLHARLHVCNTRVRNSFGILHLLVALTRCLRSKSPFFNTFFGTFFTPIFHPLLRVFTPHYHVFY